MGGDDAKRIKFHMKTGTVMYELVHINNNISELYILAII